MPKMDDLIRAATDIKDQVALASTALATGLLRLEDVASQDPRLMSVADDIQEAMDALRDAHDAENTSATAAPPPMPETAPPLQPPEPNLIEQDSSYHGE